MLLTNATWKMAKALLSKPLLLLPTLWGTFESVWYAQKYFRGTHSGSGVGNAFRHGIWNALISFNCARLKSSEKAAAWAKYATDMHEEVFPNNPFDTTMDLHNNQIGRKVFLQNYCKGYKKSELIQDVLEKCDTAIGLSDYKEIIKVKEEFVYYQSVAEASSKDQNYPNPDLD